MTKLFDNIAKAWKHFVTNKKVLPLIVLVDMLFLYGLTRLHYEVFKRASVHAKKLVEMMGKQVKDIAETTQLPTLEILQSPEFTATYHQLLKYIGIFVVAGLAIWLVGKGITWFLAHKSVDKKANIKVFTLKFLGLTLAWFVAFIILAIIVLNILNYALFGVFPLIGEKGANALAILIFWVFSYFVFISYSLIPKPAFKNAFITGVKKWRDFLPVHIVNSLIFFVATTVPRNLVEINIHLMFAFVIFIALPAVAWSRVLWVATVHKVMRSE